jgi:hypothetical protein
MADVPDLAEERFRVQCDEHDDRDGQDSRHDSDVAARERCAG